jgi:hypothetical protein
LALGRTLLQNIEHGEVEKKRIHWTEQYGTYRRCPDYLEQIFHFTYLELMTWLGMDTKVSENILVKVPYFFFEHFVNLKCKDKNPVL